MDFFFEDDIDEVGAETDGFCPKCKADTSHTVITKYEDEVRRVQCNVCSDVHSYRKPRGDAEEEPEAPETPAVRKQKLVKKRTWQEATQESGDKTLMKARPYDVSQLYNVGDILTHVAFGLGYVTDVQENKVEITFQDDRRVIAHGRPELASKMPSAALSPSERARKHAEAIHGALVTTERGTREPPTLETIIQILRDRARDGDTGGKGSGGGGKGGKKGAPAPGPKGAKGVKPELAKGKGPSPAAAAKTPKRGGEAVHPASAAPAIGPKGARGKATAPGAKGVVGKAVAAGKVMAGKAVAAGKAGVAKAVKAGTDAVKSSTKAVKTAGRAAAAAPSRAGNAKKPAPAAKKPAPVAKKPAPGPKKKPAKK